MGKPIIGILPAAALISVAGTSASAMPIAPPLAPRSSVDQVRWVCNEWGRCWWQGDYYRPYGYYRYRLDDDDDWRRGYRYRYGDGYYGPRWGGHGWRRSLDDDDEQ